MTARDFDIVIAGGGMVGAAVACALCGNGLRIAVVEKQAPPLDWPREEIDLRVSAINHASQHLLENIGAWDAIRERGIQPYREMRVWDQPSIGDIHFDSAAIGESDLGHIIQNRAIQAALWERMQACDDIALLTPAVITQMDEEPGGLSLLLDDGSRLACRLAVAADGASSRLRDMAGISVDVHDFHQFALVTTVATPDGHAETAWQRFLPNGPLAFLPVSPTHCSIVWSTTGEESQQLLEMHNDDFCAALREASGGRLGTLVCDGARARFPLRSQHAESYLAPRLVLVGDAAHQIHPLAGQGVNLGLRDAAVLAGVILSAKEAGEPWHARPVLRRYERARRGDNELTRKSMEAFNGLFSNSILPLRLLRNLGLGAADRSAIAKRLFMQHALGSTGDQPALCRKRFAG
ncbi:MAG: UbiH/UbiF/VisC/COQ6 family ubiquinone biosynthesis hydroxylase [Gammaproteobacteria bacterium]